MLAINQSWAEIKKTISAPEFFSNKDHLDPKEHSKIIDRYLGFRILKIERKLIQQYRTFSVSEDSSPKKSHSELKGKGESWIGLHPQVLQTPYSELYEIFNLISGHNISSVVDIGCAYGRIGIISKAFFPNAHFQGFEIVKKRIIEAQRISDYYQLGLAISDTNVLDEDFILPKASVYFIYDFSEFLHIKSVLSKIEEKIGKHPFILVARGDEVRSIIQLYFPIFYTANTPIYRKDWSIFFR